MHMVYIVLVYYTMYSIICVYVHMNKLISNMYISYGYRLSFSRQKQACFYFALYLSLRFNVILFTVDSERSSVF